MKARAFLLLLLVLSVAADDKLAKEQERIRKRKSLREAFNSAEKLVTDKFEKFALQHIRNWEAALADLANEKPEVVANPVRYYLLDEDWEVQAFACAVAGAKDLAALVPDLEAAYDTARYPIIRRKAMEAVASMAKSKTVKKTPNLLKKGIDDKEPGVRMFAVEGLEWLADKKNLTRMLKDKDHDTRFRARSAMARLGDTAARSELLKGFRSYVATKDLQRRASLELYDVGERYSQYLNGVALGYWGGRDAIKLLSRALNRQGVFRNKLFLSIGSAASLGKARPVEAKAQAERMRALKTAIGNGDAVVRAMGAFATGFTGDAGFVRPLKMLLGDAQVDVRHNAAEALGRIPGTAAVAALASAIKTSRDVPVRLAAVRGLGRHTEPEAVAPLVRALKDKRYMVRVAAARMLGRKGPRAIAAVPALVKATRDRDYGVREAAVVALARTGAKEGIEALARALRDRDAGVRIRALRSLARHKHRDVVRQNKLVAEASVALLLKARESLQRKAARECLIQVRSPHSVPFLLNAIDADRYSYRLAASAVLRNYNGGKTLNYGAQMPKSKRRESVYAWKTWWKEGGPIRALPPPPKKRASQDLPSFHKYTRDLRWRGIDLVLAYDSTGSMIPVIRAVKQRLDILIEESARIVTNLRMSLFTYRDEGEEYVFYGTPLTYATGNLKAFVQVAEANRGGDLPEAITATVTAAIDRLDWRKDAQKVIVVIGDAPFHPENANRLFDAVRKFARKENRGTVHAIYTDPNRLGESIGARPRRSNSNTTYPFLDRLGEMAKAGGGKAITIEDTEMLIYELLVLSFGEKWRAELEARLDFD